MSGPPVVIDDRVLGQYAAVSLYNSPYPAHEEGRAIDLYPGEGRGGRAPSPVAGTVLETRTVRAPTRPYASGEDHLIVVDAGDRLARLLHVDPAVEEGERVAVGDDLGSTVRSGYFHPWVDDHVHLGFRPPGADPVRAGGSLPIRIDGPVAPVAWDGTGEVIERGETYVVLDSPEHPSPGDGFAGVAAAGDRGTLGALDGGVPHYDRGGVVGPETMWGEVVDGTAVSVLGERVGVARSRHVAWDPIDVLANGEPIDGLSLALYRDRIAMKLVSRNGVSAGTGDRIEVGIRRDEGA